MPSTRSFQHESFKLHGSQTLFAQAWTPTTQPSGQVGVVHGLGEHSSRYASFAGQLAQKGFRVVGYDQRGHGRSKGLRGDAPSYEVLLDDIEVLIAEMTARHKGLPTFLFGHSLGGNLVLNLALRRRPNVRGIVASSPLLLPTSPPPQWKAYAATFLQRVCPTFRFKTGVQADQLSHNPEVVADYESDPLVHNLVSARIALGMLDAGRWALEHAAELTTPTLLLHGSSDCVTSVEATAQFAAQAGQACSLHTFPGLYHELHWEQERDTVLNVILQWLAAEKIPGPLLRYSEE